MKRQAGSLSDRVMNAMLETHAYAFIAAVVAALFAINYYILSPSNFDSFSTTLRYFISALAALLTVVIVSFNTFALRNQLSNMPSSMGQLEKQLDKVADLVGPLLDLAREYKLKDESSGRAALYYTDAIKSALLAGRAQAAEAAAADEEKQEKLASICRELASEIGHLLEMYGRLSSPCRPVAVSTSDYVQRMKFVAEAGIKWQRLPDLLPGRFAGPG